MSRRTTIITLLIAVILAPLVTAASCGHRCEDCGKTVKVTVLEGVNFDFNKYEVRGDDKAKLDKDVELLKGDKTLDVSIEGHCDIVGSDGYNQKLSERRAKTVFAYLVSQGVDAGRMKAVGFGRTKPIVPNDTDANRAKNRRVEIRIIKARP